MLHKLAAFLYVPAYEDDKRWSRTWRWVEFHPGGLSGNGCYAPDVDIDALQLFIALRTTLLAQCPLHSVELHTRAHAFWGMPHRRLLDWSDRVNRSSPSCDSIEAGLDSWYEDTGGSLNVIRHAEALTRHLVTWERGFSRLTRLTCRIDTSWSDEPGDLESLAAGVSHSLEQATGLKQLDLVLSRDGVDR